MTRKYCKLGEAQFHFDSQIIKRLEKFPKSIWRALDDAHEYPGYYTSFSSVCVCVYLILTLEGPSQFEGIHVIATPLQCTHVYVHDRICLVVYDEERPWVGDIPKLDSSTTLSSLLSFTLKGPYHFETLNPLNTLQSIHV